MLKALYRGSGDTQKATCAENHCQCVKHEIAQICHMGPGHRKGMNKIM